MSTIKRSPATTLFILMSVVPAAARANPADPAAPSPEVTAPAPRPVLLTALYGSFVGLQVLDIDSTMRAVRSGAGQEGNPALQSIVGSSGALVGVKAGTTASVILVCERLRKEHHPLAAVLLMIGVNSAYATISARNYSALQHRQ
jgi:hypothetical protein